MRIENHGLKFEVLSLKLPICFVSALYTLHSALNSLDSEP